MDPNKDCHKSRNFFLEQPFYMTSSPANQRFVSLKKVFYGFSSDCVCVFVCARCTCVYVRVHECVLGTIGSSRLESVRSPNKNGSSFCTGPFSLCSMPF